MDYCKYSAHLVRIFHGPPVQLSVRQRKVKKETVGRWWRSSVLGAQPAVIHLTYLPGRWRRYSKEPPLATHTPFQQSETSTSDLCDGLYLEVTSM